MSSMARSIANTDNTFARRFPLEPFISKAKQAKGMAAMLAMEPTSVGASAMWLNVWKNPKWRAEKSTPTNIGFNVPIAAKIRLNVAILVASRLRFSYIRPLTLIDRMMSIWSTTQRSFSSAVSHLRRWVCRKIVNPFSRMPISANSPSIPVSRLLRKNAPVDRNSTFGDCASR